MTYRFIACHDEKETKELYQMLLDHSVPVERMDTVLRLHSLTKVQLALIREQTQELGLQIRHHGVPINPEDLERQISRIRMVIQGVGQTPIAVRQPDHDHVQVLIKHLPGRLRRQLQQELDKAMKAPEPPPWYRKEDWIGDREQRRSEPSGRMGRLASR
jgi:hypothetical protein